MYKPYLALFLTVILTPATALGQQPGQQPRSNFHDEYQEYIGNSAGCWVIPQANLRENSVVDIQTQGGVIARNRCGYTGVKRVRVSAAHTVDAVNIILINVMNSRYLQQRNRRQSPFFTETQSLRFGESLTVAARDALLIVTVEDFNEAVYDVTLELQQIERY